MKSGLFIAAVLCSKAVFAFPYPGPAPYLRKTLVGRAGSDRSSSGSSHSGGGGHRSSNNRPHYKPAEGYDPKGVYHNPPTREQGRKLEAKGGDYDRSNKGAPRVVHESDSDEVEPHTSYISVRKKPGDQKNVVTYRVASDQPTHYGHFDYRERALGKESSRNAEYKPKPDVDKRKRRQETIGGVAKMGQLPGTGRKPGLHIDETPSTEMELTNENQGATNENQGSTSEDQGSTSEDQGPNTKNRDQVGIQPFTAAYVKDKESPYKDSPGKHKTAQAARENDAVATYEIRSSDDEPPPVIIPARGPKDPTGKHPDPVDTRTKKDHGVKRRHHSSSSGGSGSSGRTKRSNNFDWRDYVIVSGFARPSPSKRDVTDMASTEQINREATHPDEKTSFSQDYEQYLQEFDAVRTDASDIIMPFIEEMVNGSSSELVWDAAWEIFSMIDPNIQVIGPVSVGMHCFDWIEDQIENTTDKDTFDSVLAVHGVLEAMYLETWHNAQNALNSSGVLDLLWAIEDDLATNDTALAQTGDALRETKKMGEFFLKGPDSIVSVVQYDSSPSSTRKGRTDSASGTDVPLASSTAPGSDATATPDGAPASASQEATSIFTGNATSTQEKH